MKHSSQNGTSVSSDGDEGRDWSDWGEDDEEQLATKSLFSETILPSAKDALDYDAREHGFDLRLFRIEVGQRNPHIKKSTASHEDVTCAEETHRL